MAALPNIVLLTIDALRADHLSCQGYERETPTLNTLAEEWIHAYIAASVSLHTREAIRYSDTKDIFILEYLQCS